MHDTGAWLFCFVFCWGVMCKGGGNGLDSDGSDWNDGST